MRAARSFAHDSGDQWLEALAMESIGKTSLVALRVAPSLALAPEAAEYVSFPTGQPVAFHELRELLAGEEMLLL